MAQFDESAGGTRVRLLGGLCRCSVVSQLQPGHRARAHIHGHLGIDEQYVPLVHAHSLDDTAAYYDPRANDHAAADDFGTGDNDDSTGGGGSGRHPGGDR